MKDFEATKEVLKKMEINFFTYAATPQLTVSRILKRIPLDYSAAEELKRATGHTMDVGEMTGWTREAEREERTRTTTTTNVQGHDHPRTDGRTAES